MKDLGVRDDTNNSESQSTVIGDNNPILPSEIDGQLWIKDGWTIDIGIRRLKRKVSPYKWSKIVNTSGVIFITIILAFSFIIFQYSRNTISLDKAVNIVLKDLQIDKNEKVEVQTHILTGGVWNAMIGNRWWVIDVKNNQYKIDAFTGEIIVKTYNWKDIKIE